jgi:membrane protease YdiL (CAAX protease family)
MKERWRPIGILTAGLFVVNLIARLVVRFGAGKNDGKQITIGLWALIAVGAVLIPVAYWWARRYPIPRVVGDMGLAVVFSCVLAVVVGPLVSGTHPFNGAPRSPSSSSSTSSRSPRAAS